MNERDALQRRWSMIANVRLALFAGIAVLGWIALRTGSADAWIAASAMCMLAVAVVGWHRRLNRRRRDLSTLIAVNDRAIARYRLDWSATPADAPTDSLDAHPYATDLDIVGDASLSRRISTPALPSGWDTLHRWLLSAADVGDIARRQEAVRELAPRLELRQRIEAVGISRTEPFAHPEPFLAWCDHPAERRVSRIVWLLAIASPLAFVALSVAFWTGVVVWPWWLIPLVANVVIFLLAGGGMAEKASDIDAVRAAVDGSAEVFRTIADEPASAAMLLDIAADLDGPAGGAARMRRLGRIASCVVPRGSIVWLPLQLALLWDLHIRFALEHWRADPGNQPRLWFRQVGAWEALAALSVLAHDFPEWRFPTIDPTVDSFVASGLSHPLIEPGSAVANDVVVGPSGTFLFVTGSNMSGKSTLLRAIGVNAVLAMAGAPVAAMALAMPPVGVVTCMRVEDSLARGVSFFMAELLRLKRVIDATTATTARRSLYLLDEILQGTNTSERQIASRQVLARLAATPAIGAVSSHDLDLVAGTPLGTRAVAVHFAETLTHGPDGVAMSFDYRLRPGIATSTNALALMQMLGFELENLSDASP